MRKQVAVEIFNKKVILSERNWFDTLTLSKAMDNVKFDHISAHYFNCVAINNSLKYYLRWHRYFLRSKYSTDKLFKKLTFNESTELVNKLSEIEGTKKKVVEEVNQLVETSQEC